MLSANAAPDAPDADAARPSRGSGRGRDSAAPGVTERLRAALATNDRDVLTADLAQALDAMRAGAAERGGPLPGADPAAVHSRVRGALDGAALPEDGVGTRAALRALCTLAGWGAADAGHPRCAGHLHPPPLAAAVAADTVAAATNQSLDSWDQSPAMTGLEKEVLDALGELVYGPASQTSGVVTTGGTESNMMGLLLARTAVCRRVWGVDVMRTGVPPQADRLRIYCSATAHFSAQRMAGVLGLGEECVVSVPVDADHRMRPRDLQRLLRSEPGTHPLAVVATAGTTDAGAVDPLPRVAAVAREHQCWLHVDAAYGGGALFSRRLEPLLDGLELADSVALDLHKLGWQPTAAGVFLARGPRALAPLARQVAYLNTVDDEEAGYTSLLGHSVRTTRRPDVLKMAVTLRALGRVGLGGLVDRCHDLARHAAARVDDDPRLERALPVTLTSVVFRYARHEQADLVNARVRRELLGAGTAVVGRCELDGEVWLKLTLLNHEAAESDVDALVDLVGDTGTRIGRELR
jgi:L-2,4-diaminobutyrate decarboxylase